MPVFNEAATLAACVERVRGARLPPHWTRRIRFVDDASTDESPRLLERLREEGTVLRHERNRGKGAAIRTGFGAVLDDPRTNEADAVLIQDADLEYDPADYARLLEPIASHRARVVYGTRFGGHYRRGGPGVRIHALGNRAITALSNLCTGYRLHDMECCYKVLAAPVLDAMFPMLTEERFGIEPQITAALARIGEPIVEAPVSYEPRSVGEGKKIKWSDGVAAVRVILRERFLPPAVRGKDAGS